MRCEKAKRWISEVLDGRLSEKKRFRLDAHLENCSICRSYKTGLERVQREAILAGDKGPGPEYFAALLIRLRARLKAEDAAALPIERHAPAFFPRGRWAWAGAASLLFAAAGIFFISSRTRLPQESYWPAFDEPLASFEHQISDNPEVAAEFDQAVRKSLRETAGIRHADVEPLLADHTMLVESLTEEEIQAFDAALQKEISGTQGRI
jgi:anti-sigma factor RsiW